MVRIEGGINSSAASTPLRDLRRPEQTGHRERAGSGDRPRPDRRTGTGLRKWKPECDDKPLDGINTGHTEKGFFVEISAKRMRPGYHIKTDPKAESVDWEFPLDEPIAAPG